MMDVEDVPLMMTLDRYESIFKDNYSSLFHYVNSILKDDDQSKDVISDLFLNIWQQKDSLQINHIKPYLFRAARNGALKAVRLKNQTVTIDEDLFNVAADTRNPFEWIAAKQSVKIVERLINKLSTKRREILELRLIGLKNHEIARVLEVPEKTIEYNMREVIEQLTRYVQQSNLDKATIAGGLLLVTIIFSIN